MAKGKIGCAAVLLSGLLVSQAAAQGVERSPAMLPFDNPPPSVAALLAPPRPPMANPAPRPAPPAGPALATALEAAQAALRQCAKDGLKVGVAVTDSGGNLLVGLSADGANPGRILFATRKANGAVAYGLPTSAVQEKLRAGDATALAAAKPYMMLGPGAVPLMKNGKALGAIGVSGASSQQDEACAAFAAGVVKDKL